MAYIGIGISWHAPVWDLPQGTTNVHVQLVDIQYYGFMVWDNIKGFSLTIQVHTMLQPAFMSEPSHTEGRLVRCYKKK
jgi:hypothetical protein